MRYTTELICFCSSCSYLAIMWYTAAKSRSLKSAFYTVYPALVETETVYNSLWKIWLLLTACSPLKKHPCRVISGPAGHFKMFAGLQETKYRPQLPQNLFSNWKWELHATYWRWVMLATVVRYSSSYLVYTYSTSFNPKRKSLVAEMQLPLLVQENIWRVDISCHWLLPLGYRYGVSVLISV